MTQPPVTQMGGGLGNMDYLKSQVLTMFALKSNNTEDGIFMAIWAIVLISIIDVCFRYLPIVMQKLHALAHVYITNKVSKHTNISNLINTSNTKEEDNSVILVRNYFEKDPNLVDYELVDAVLDYVCSLDNAKHIKFVKRFYLDTTTIFEINKDISVKLENITFDNQTGNINSITIKLISYKLKISEIKAFIAKIHAEYRIEKNNKLGTQKYFFNEIHIAPMREMNGSYRFETAPKRITFNMTPFNTFKSIDNIFGTHIKEIRDRVNLFINHPEWYAKRGIPHTLGILLHGPPGCGKTSLIKAIAKDTGRHVFNISLRKTTTQRQLLNLFFDENVAVMNGSNENNTLAIPLDKRIYVIEDVDCMTDIVLDRKYLELLKRMNNKKPIAMKDLQEFVHSSDTDYDEIIAQTKSISNIEDISKHTDKYGNVGRSIDRSRSVIRNKDDNNFSTPIEKVTNEFEMNGEQVSQNHPIRNMNMFDGVTYKSALDEAFTNDRLDQKLLQRNFLSRSFIMNSDFNGIDNNPPFSACNMNDMNDMNDMHNINNTYLINNETTSESSEDENNTNSKNSDKKKKKKKDKNEKKDESKDELTLSFLLNLLDGVLETPGRIIIMTSNYPKRLDKALVRPGRIDINLHFDMADIDMIKEMLSHFYDITMDELNNLELKLNDKINKKYTPAEVISILCNNYNNYENAIQQINNVN
jgi:SpoVK/Ycf46/Vps4 family AAA+-type ATPase